jgi:hypothetical protein
MGRKTEQIRNKKAPLKSQKGYPKFNDLLVYDLYKSMFRNWLTIFIFGLN